MQPADRVTRLRQRLAAAWRADAEERGSPSTSDHNDVLGVTTFAAFWVEREGLVPGLLQTSVVRPIVDSEYARVIAVLRELELVDLIAISAQALSRLHDVAINAGWGPTGMHRIVERRLIALHRLDVQLKRDACRPMVRRATRPVGRRARSRRSRSQSVSRGSPGRPRSSDDPEPQLVGNVTGSAR